MDKDNTKEKREKLSRKSSFARTLYLSVATQLVAKKFRHGNFRDHQLNFPHVALTSKQGRGVADNAPQVGQESIPCY